jgi:hypothetical protein
MLFITSGGYAADRGYRFTTMNSISESFHAPDLSSSVPDTCMNGTPKPDHHGDPDDPDRVPHLVLLIMSRLFVLGR